MLYSITFLDHSGKQQFSRVFQTIKAARKWASWLTKKPAVFRDVTIWSGQPGGERVSA